MPLTIDRKLSAFRSCWIFTTLGKVFSAPDGVIYTIRFPIFIVLERNYRGSGRCVLNLALFFDYYVCGRAFAGKCLDLGNECVARQSPCFASRQMCSCDGWQCSGLRDHRGLDKQRKPKIDLRQIKKPAFSSLLIRLQLFYIAKNGRAIMEERFDRLLEKLDKTISEIGFVEWALLMLVGVRIATLVAD